MKRKWYMSAAIAPLLCYASDGGAAGDAGGAGAAALAGDPGSGGGADPNAGGGEDPNAGSGNGAPAAPEWAAGIDGLNPKHAASIEAKGWVKDGKPDIAKLITGYGEMESLQGKMLPSFDPEKPAEWSGWKKFGHPDSPDGYQPNFDAAGGAEINKDLFNGVAASMHKAGAPPHMVQAAVDGFIDHVKAETDRKTAEITQRKNDLDAHLNAAFGENRKAEEARLQSVVKQLLPEAGEEGSDDAATLNRVNELLGDKGLFDLFGKVAAMAEEGSFLTGEGGAQNFSTSADVASAIKAKQADADFMAKYEDKTAAGHNEAVAEMTALYEQRTKLKNAGK